MKNKHRAASAKVAASTYAPMPSGSLLTFGFIGASVALVCLFLFANFYSLDLSGHLGLLAGGVVVAFVAGLVLREVLRRRHFKAVTAEYELRTPRAP